MSASSLSSVPDASSSVLRQRWFLVGLSAFFLVIALNYYLKIHAGERGTRTAFKRWDTQIDRMDRGENIWETTLYPNPPIMALILKPLADLPDHWGSTTWFLLK